MISEWQFENYAFKNSGRYGRGVGDESHVMSCCDDAGKIVKLESYYLFLFFESYYYVARNC